MSQKLQFVEKAAVPGANISALCREFGISRQTGHKWLRRFRAQGHPGLVEQSRRPLVSPFTTAEEAVVRILELRDQHWSWGPDKISRALRRAHGDDAPSKSTVARVLRRLGKMCRRRLFIEAETGTQSIVTAEGILERASEQAARALSV
jgi:transposase-like protein